jgi:hypothetical protein
MQRRKCKEEKLFECAPVKMQIEIMKFHWMYINAGYDETNFPDSYRRSVSLYLQKYKFVSRFMAGEKTLLDEMEDYDPIPIPHDFVPRN